MARKGRQDDEVTEDIEADEPAPAGAEFVPEASLKPKSDVYTLVLILTFVAFLAGCILAGREAWEHYDVQFWVFSKDGKQQPAPPASGTGTTGAPSSDPASTPPPATTEPPKTEAPKEAPKENPK